MILKKTIPRKVYAIKRGSKLNGEFTYMVPLPSANYAEKVASR